MGFIINSIFIFLIFETLKPKFFEHLKKQFIKKGNEEIETEINYKVDNTLNEMLWDYLSYYLVILISAYGTSFFTSNIEIIRYNISLAYMYVIIKIIKKIFFINNYAKIYNTYNPKTIISNYGYDRIKQAVNERYDNYGIIFKLFVGVGLAPSEDEIVNALYGKNEYKILRALYKFFFVIVANVLVFNFMVGPFLIDPIAKIEDYGWRKAFLYPYLRTIDFALGTETLYVIGIDIKKNYFSTAEYEEIASEANNFYFEKKYNNAIELYSKIINSNCADYNNSSVYYNIGLSYYKTKNNEKSKEYFEKHLQSSPESTSTLYYLACLYEQDNDNQKSKEYYKKIVHLKYAPDDNPK